MANLIVTIIGIALLAILAIGGIMYVTPSMDNGQAQSWANAMISQEQQLMSASTAYSVDHGGADFSTFGFSALINNGYLSAWPPLAMMPPMPSTGSFTTGNNDLNNVANSFSAVCPPVNGYQGFFGRWACAYNGINAISFYMKLNDPYNAACGGQNAGLGYGFENAKYANHPYVALARAVNKITGAVPAAATIAGSGLPYYPAGSDASKSCTAAGGSTNHLAIDSSGNVVANYCYLNAGSGTSITSIVCTFTN